MITDQDLNMRALSLLWELSCLLQPGEKGYYIKKAASRAHGMIVNDPAVMNYVYEQTHNPIRQPSQEPSK